MKRTAKRPGKNGRSRRPAPASRAPVVEIPSLPAVELTGLLDSLKATVIALLASLGEKERDLQQRLRDEPTDGVRTGLEDIRTLRRWADKTFNTIEVLERCEPGRLGLLLEELGEFERILHAHDVSAGK